MHNKLLLLFILLATSGQLARAATVTVGANATQSQIQAVIDQAQDGDTISLPAATYNFNDPTPLRITKGIKFKGTTDELFIANTLVTTDTAPIISFTGTLHVASTAGFYDPASGTLGAFGLLDVCSDAECGTITYTGKTGNTFTGCLNPATTADVGFTPYTHATLGNLTSFSFVGQGMCRDRTIITFDNIKNGIVVSNPDGTTADISGITFQEGSSLPMTPSSWFTLQSKSFRFHHCHVGTRFQSLMGGRFGGGGGTDSGVIDHCVLEDPNPKPADPVSQNFANNQRGNAFPNTRNWDQPSGFQTQYGRGGSFYRFFEDNYFWTYATQGAAATNTFDGAEGLRIVIRHNIIFNPRIFCHGTEGPGRGGRFIENYDNIFVSRLDVNQIEFASRSGVYLMLNNTFYGPEQLQPSYGPSIAFRVLSSYFTSGRLGSAYGWNPWDVNDTATGIFTGANASKLPDATMTQPIAGSGSFEYTPTNGFYVMGTVAGQPTPSASCNPGENKPSTTCPSVKPTLTDTSKNWGLNQWLNFSMVRVQNAVQPGGINIGANPVDLGSLGGTGIITLSPGAGPKLIFSRQGGSAPGAPKQLGLGCLTIAGTGGALDKHILYQWIGGDTIEGCYSPDTGTVLAGTTVTTGDMAGAPIISSDTNTITELIDTGNGNQGPFLWANGDKYVIARVLSPQDASTRGYAPDQTIGFPPHNFHINQRTGTALWPGNRMEPDYVYNNVRPATTTIGPKKVIFNGNAGSWLAPQNRDIFNDADPSPSATPWPSNTTNVHTAGIVSGTLANMPDSSHRNYGGLGDITGVTVNPPWVGYYATDAVNPLNGVGARYHLGVLYVLTGTPGGGAGSWTQWWAPYTYPHPLAQAPASGAITESFAQFIIGSSNSFTIHTTGFSSAPTITAACSPSVWCPSNPPNVTFSDNGDGTATIAGTANTATAGDYLTSLTATAGAQTTTQQFTLRIGANAPPTVSITTNGTTFLTSDGVTITASPLDSDGQITQVQFKDGAANLGLPVTASPYTYTGQFSAGSHNLTAVATDNGGLTGTSNTISITVTGVSATPTPPAQIILKP